ncbi:hypothetical protein [Embleya sp. NBC_00896]|uniref:hypothetical protein n=1 Tax=Embleya sp. NBC_00896 TaxID=2975961 RepID=UPI00386D495A|nr:hypothetical protein OG928_18015 [Embleya sp. NBC_00896]
MQAQTKKILSLLLVVFVIYTIIATPEKAADLVAQWFQAMSSAAKWCGDQISGLAS